MKYTWTEDRGALQTKLDFGTLTISGNSELGFRPFQLLVSSIAGCSSLVFKRILEKKRIAYDRMEVEAEVEREKDGVSRVRKITLHFTVTGSNLDQGQVEKALAIAAKNCSMVQSVKGAIEVVETVTVREE